MDASAPARDAIDEFLRHLAGRDLSASTRRIRKTFLNEYLRHAQQAAGAEKQLTARELLDGERATAWLADAAEGKTRTRNTLRGPDAAAYPNSMRVRADTLNAFAEFLGEEGRVDRQAPAQGYHLTPADTEKLLHELTVKRPIHANAMTALRTAAVAAVIADTGRGVPEIADLKVGALHLEGEDGSADIDGGSFPLTRTTAHILTRWLAARAAIIAELEGSDPGHLWIPTKPGRPRGGVPSAKPGINPAAVRTLHASHRSLVSQLLGTPLRPGALRAAAAAAADDRRLLVLNDHQLVLVPVAEEGQHRHPAVPLPASSAWSARGSAEPSETPVICPGWYSPCGGTAPPPGGVTSARRSPSPNGMPGVSENPRAERDRLVLAGHRDIGRPEPVPGGGGGEGVTAVVRMTGFSGIGGSGVSIRRWPFRSGSEGRPETGPG